jgi:hypothetical protein
MFILYLLCKSLINYAYFITGYQPVPRQNRTPRDNKNQPVLEEIKEQEGSSAEDEEEEEDAISAAANFNEEEEEEEVEVEVD